MLLSFGLVGLGAGAATNAVPKVLTHLSPLPSAGRGSSGAGAGQWQGFKQPGNQVMALARDRAGRVWVGT